MPVVKKAPKKSLRGSGKSYQIGEKCLALYHEDGLWYDAEVEVWIRSKL
jgi:hypothetical protein